MTTDTLSKARTVEVMVLLAAINCLNILDRNMPYMLMEAIRKDLRFADTQIGLLGGIFAVVYATCGVPLGRLADRGLSRQVIAGAVAFWSVVTALGGLAQNFTHLALARLGVAVGEAGSTPASHAIIAEHFPPQRRATMLSLFSVGTALGAMLGLILGGWLVDHLGWRAAFGFIGIPGVLLALLALWRLPRSGVRRSTVDQAGMWRSVVRFFTIPTFTLNALACACYAFAAYATVIWLPSFFQRVHKLSAGQTGLWLGLVTGCAGLVGLPLCGYLADRLSLRNPRWRLRVPALCMIISAPFVLAMISASSWKLALALYCVPQALTNACIGPAFSAAHTVVPPHLRALASSCLLGLLTILGAGFGPPLVGAISDLLGAAQDTRSLAKALLILPAVMALSGVLFWAAARRLPRDTYVGD